MLIPFFIFFLIRWVFSKENISSIMQKFFLKRQKRPKGRLIWINGVSIGEAKTGILIAEEITTIVDFNILF